MKLLKRLVATISVFSVFLGARVSAEPISFQLDSVSQVGASIPYDMTFTPSLPIVGSGDIDFGTGTGVVSLPTFSMHIDLSQDSDLDATVTYTGWEQTITSIVAGAVTSTSAGSIACIDEGGTFGAAICGSFSTTVIAWPPSGGGGSAVIDTVAKTITVVTPDPGTSGVVTLVYSYEALAAVPSLHGIAGGGLLALALIATALLWLRTNERMTGEPV